MGTVITETFRAKANIVMVAAGKAVVLYCWIPSRNVGDNADYTEVEVSHARYADGSQYYGMLQSHRQVRTNKIQAGW